MVKLWGMGKWCFFRCSVVVDGSTSLDEFRRVGVFV